MTSLFRGQPSFTQFSAAQAWKEFMFDIVSDNGACRPAAIAEASILVTSHLVKCLQFIWRSGIHRWNIRVPDLQMSCRFDLKIGHQDSSPGNGNQSDMRCCQMMKHCRSLSQSVSMCITLFYLSTCLPLILSMSLSLSLHDDVIKWKHFPRYWPFVWEIHRSPVNSPHKDQWRGALMLSLIFAWINGWVNNREAGDLRRHRAHSDVIVMIYHIQPTLFLILILAVIEWWVVTGLVAPGSVQVVRHQVDEVQLPEVTTNTGLILGLRPANERRRYFVTTSHIGWAQA